MTMPKSRHRGGQHGFDWIAVIAKKRGAPVSPVGRL